MNAKKEFLEKTLHVKIIAAQLCPNVRYGEDDITYDLNPGYTEEEYDVFLKNIDFEYDSGFGGQELFGVIICENGVWFDRGEYDGSEWWEKHEYPKLENYFSEKIIIHYKRLKKLQRILNENEIS